jgi:hypothetical protein
MFPFNHICCCFSILVILLYVNYVFFDIIWWLWLVLASTLHLFIIFFLFIVHVIHQPCSSTHFSSLDVMFTFPKVKHWYLGSQKYIKDVIGEFCTDTFVISTNFSYFFKNLSSRMLFICEMSFLVIFNATHISDG